MSSFGRPGQAINGLSADDGFLVVGAYPAAGAYDECTTIVAER
jgi:hypothetical protein